MGHNAPPSLLSTLNPRTGAWSSRRKSDVEAQETNLEQSSSTGEQPSRPPTGEDRGKLQKESDSERSHQIRSGCETASPFSRHTTCPAAKGPRLRILGVPITEMDTVPSDNDAQAVASHASFEVAIPVQGDHSWAELPVPQPFRQDRLKLGGIEYRSLRLLLKITSDSQRTVEVYRVAAGMRAFYSSQTMVDNLGFTLTPDSMISQYFLSSLSTPSDLDNVEARAYSLGYEGAPSISPRSPTTLLHSPLSLSADMDPL
ncbi:hypothetical protein V498_04245, partial [Pseudogymnoascus sp. VKM F-4517 (FW-2822)]